MITQFYLEIEPLPCPRPRIAMIAGHGVAYYPKAYKEWAAEATKQAAKAWRDQEAGTLGGLVSLRLSFFCSRPKTTKLQAPKGDIDNYVKSVMDALTKAGVWLDDKQVVELVARKTWNLPQGIPGIAVSLEAL